MSSHPFGPGPVQLPGATELPDVNAILETIPMSRKHRFESAGELIRKLAGRIGMWRESTPENTQPVILTFLPDGTAVEVHRLSEDGHSAIVVEGLVNGAPAMFLAHQSNLQLLCYSQEMENPQEEERKIGFVVEGEQIEA